MLFLSFPTCLKTLVFFLHLTLPVSFIPFHMVVRYLPLFSDSSFTPFHHFLLSALLETQMILIVTCLNHLLHPLTADTKSAVNTQLSNGQKDVHIVFVVTTSCAAFGTRVEARWDVWQEIFIPWEDDITCKVISGDPLNLSEQAIGTIQNRKIWLCDLDSWFNCLGRTFLHPELLFPHLSRGN